MIYWYVVPGPIGMVDERYRSLEDVLLDPLFPALDLRLRSGCHIDSADIAEHELLTLVADLLQGFYSGYQCRLVHAVEGYWYLLSDGDLLGHRRLSTAEMLVGQVLALMRMDPAWLSDTGWLPRGKVIETLENLLGHQRLVAQLAPRSRGRDHHADDRKVREAVDKALNGLEALGFVGQRRETGELMPRPCLMRFLEPVRSAGDVREALIRLVREGEVELDEDETDAGDREETDDD